MADEKETGFKVSDRRMFNPDGSLRQPDSEPEDRKGEATESSRAARERAVESDNVISPAGDTEKEGSQGGQGRPAGASAGPSAQPAGAPGPFETVGDQGRSPADRPEYDTFPEASLAGLVNMLAVEAAMHLGLIENPMGGGVSVDLESARHVIDMIAMLQQKTRGNLTSDEERLLDDVLAELRMQFVAVSRGR